LNKGIRLGRRRRMDEIRLGKEMKGITALWIRVREGVWNKN
jgi:hypothetical protein